MQLNLTKPTHPQVIEAMKTLKDKSDILCPFMAKVFPMTPQKHVEMTLCALIDLGFKITKD